MQKNWRENRNQADCGYSGYSECNIWTSFVPHFNPSWSQRRQTKGNHQHFQIWKSWSKERRNKDWLALELVHVLQGTENYKELHKEWHNLAVHWWIHIATDFKGNLLEFQHFIIKEVQLVTDWALTSSTVYFKVQKTRSLIMRKNWFPQMLTATGVGKSSCYILVFRRKNMTKEIFLEGIKVCPGKDLVWQWDNLWLDQDGVDETFRWPAERATLTHPWQIQIPLIDLYEMVTGIDENWYCHHSWWEEQCSSTTVHQQDIQVISL